MSETMATLIRKVSLCEPPSALPSPSVAAVDLGRRGGRGAPALSPRTKDRACANRPAILLHPRGDRTWHALHAPADGIGAGTRCGSARRPDRPELPAAPTARFQPRSSRAGGRGRRGCALDLADACTPPVVSHRAPPVGS